VTPTCFFRSFSFFALALATTACAASRAAAAERGSFASTSGWLEASTAVEVLARDCPPMLGEPLAFVGAGMGALRAFGAGGAAYVAAWSESNLGEGLVFAGACASLTDHWSNFRDFEAEARTGFFDADLGAGSLPFATRRIDFPTLANKSWAFAAEAPTLLQVACNNWTT